MKLTRNDGWNDDEIDTINKAVDILYQELTPKPDYEDLQKKVMARYLSGISVSELVNICR